MIFGGVGSILVPSCALIWCEPNVEAVSKLGALWLLSALWGLVFSFMALHPACVFHGRIVVSLGRYTLGGLNSISIT